MAGTIEVILLIVVGLPFLLAGLVVFFLGWRAKGKWSAPTCVRCGYDLRGTLPDRSPRCPECGADLVSSPRAVRYARGTRHWGLLSLAIVIWLLPVLAIASIAGFAWWQMRSRVNPGTLRVQPTAVVIQQAVAKPDEYRAWQELDSRLQAGTLTHQDVETVLQGLIAHMTSTKPDGWDQPFHWQSPFLATAMQRGAIQDATLCKLFDAYNGPLRILPIERLRSGSPRAPVTVQLKSNWDLGGGLILLNELKAVKIDGKPAAFSGPSRAGSQMGISITTVPAVGEHELTVEVDSALIAPDQARGMPPNPPASTWPPAVRRWTRTASAKFTVYPADAQLVKLIDDPARDPVARGDLSVQWAVVRMRQNSKYIVVRFGDDIARTLPVSFDVVMVAGSERISMGKLWRVKTGTLSRSSNLELSQIVQELPNDIQQVDLILTPAPQHVERYPEVTEIWGKPVTLSGVPLIRYDLAVDATASPPSP